MDDPGLNHPEIGRPAIRPCRSVTGSQLIYLIATTTLHETCWFLEALPMFDCSISFPSPRGKNATKTTRRLRILKPDHSPLSLYPCSLCIQMMSAFLHISTSNAHGLRWQCVFKGGYISQVPVRDGALLHEIRFEVVSLATTRPWRQPNDRRRNFAAGRKRTGSLGCSGFSSVNFRIVSCI